MDKETALKLLNEWDEENENLIQEQVDKIIDKLGMDYFYSNTDEVLESLNLKESTMKASIKSAMLYEVMKLCNVMIEKTSMTADPEDVQKTIALMKLQTLEPPTSKEDLN